MAQSTGKRSCGTDFFELEFRGSTALEHVIALIFGGFGRLDGRETYIRQVESGRGGRNSAKALRLA